MEYIDRSDELAHYGIMGMKWGVRNAETRKRYASEGRPSRKQKKAQKAQAKYKAKATRQKESHEKSRQHVIEDRKAFNRGETTTEGWEKADFNSNERKYWLQNNQAQIDAISRSVDSWSKIIDKLDKTGKDAEYYKSVYKKGKWAAGFYL